jgi:apolipoprotein N-acyltransferase
MSAVLAGGVLALAMPGPGWWPLVFAFPPLLLEAVERAGGARWAWLLGWLAGIVHWALATNWVLDVMHHYGGLPWLGALGALVAMAAILGLFWALVVGLTSMVAPTWRIWFLPCVWVAADSLRRFQPTQFPWNDVAAVFSHSPDALASVPIWGAAGLSWAVVAIGAGLWGLMRRDRRSSAAALVIAAVGCLVTFSVLAPGFDAAGRPVRVAVIQPGTTLDEKWDPDQWEAIIGRVWNLTRQAADAGARIVLWPESAVPFQIDTDAAYRLIVTELAAELDIEIVLNSIGVNPDGGSANSAYLVTGAGISPVRYDKIHLVPFGEYVPPWAELITTEALVREVGRFEPGEAVSPLPAAVPLGVAICFEVVFPGHAAAATRAGAELLVTITNDGWYGFSWAPDQHIAQIPLRAAETRRWFARAALTGISGFVDPYGRAVSRLEIGSQGVLVADLHPSGALTPRARWGDWWAVSSAAIAAVLLAASQGGGLRRVGRRSRLPDRSEEDRGDQPAGH